MKKIFQIVSIALLAFVLQGCFFIMFMFSELTESSIQNYKCIISAAGHDSLGFPEIPKDAVWREFKLNDPEDSNNSTIMVLVNFTRFIGRYYKTYTFFFDTNKNLKEERFRFFISKNADLFHDGIDRSLTLSYYYTTKKTEYELVKTGPFTEDELNHPNYSEYANERRKREEISLEEANKLIAEWDELIRIFEEKEK